MSLTKDDLKAIRGIVEEKGEELKLHTAAGIAEVHQKIYDSEERLSRKISDGDEKLSQKIDDVELRLGRRIDGVEQNLARKIDDVKDQLKVKDQKLENTVQRVDTFEKQLKKLKAKTV